MDNNDDFLSMLQRARTTHAQSSLQRAIPDRPAVHSIHVTGTKEDLEDTELLPDLGECTATKDAVENTIISRNQVTRSFDREAGAARKLRDECVQHNSTQPLMKLPVEIRTIICQLAIRSGLEERENKIVSAAMNDSNDRIMKIDSDADSDPSEENNKLAAYRVDDVLSEKLEPSIVRVCKVLRQEQMKTFHDTLQQRISILRNYMESDCKTLLLELRPWSTINELYEGNDRERSLLVWDVIPDYASHLDRLRL
ncbi:hypothetical protein AC578_4143 [Pseudocercospora eumusae]|uniref:Uncharacterized protein n=1 Tax=Pseudocercospora eumusae TaxID=321146 RepID=A0A139HF64_9PEZI|nr:hypothetical protein AC578_4143 [Pseudocercospora eumusae]